MKYSKSEFVRDGWIWALVSLLAVVILTAVLIIGCIFVPQKGPKNCNNCPCCQEKK